MNYSRNNLSYRVYDSFLIYWKRIFYTPTVDRPAQVDEDSPASPEWVFYRTAASLLELVTRLK